MYDENGDSVTSYLVLGMCHASRGPFLVAQCIKVLIFI